MFGYPMPKMALGPMPHKATGCSPLMVTHGYPIIHGDGQPFTTAAGATTIITVGNGSRVAPGDRHGLTGAMVVVITHGPRLVRVLA